MEKNINNFKNILIKNKVKNARTCGLLNPGNKLIVELV